MKLWPRTLYGRLVVILVTGMLAAQILTSSIWYDTRHSQTLEIPTRLVAGRLADFLRLLERNPSLADRFIESLDSPRFRLSPEAAPKPAVRHNGADLATERLLQQVVAKQLGHPPDMQLLRVDLLDDHGRVAGLPTLFGGSPASGRFLVAVGLPDGRRIKVDAQEEQGWTSQAPLNVLLDYLLRIYLLRILVVVVIALLAVRLAIRPLNQLAVAAEALGHDIRRPPLTLGGPIEVRRAARAFNAMQRRLIANIAERTRFLAAVSHDLRTPITRLRLRAEMLADEQMKQRFRGDLQHMEQMVSQTLDFVRSGETNEPRELVDIDALLQSLQSDLRDVGAQVGLQGRALLPLPGYASSLKRCLQNLLDNAIRFGGRADITVDDDARRLRISVGDRGPGLPEELLEQVMEPFYRLDDARSAGSGGYGLGLSIASGIAAAHGGSLALQQRQGGGLQAVLEFARTS